jgi:hypothetical protein
MREPTLRFRTAHKISRRGALCALAAGSVAMTTPATAIDADPIFAVIVEHKKLTTDWQGPYEQLQDAEIDAASEHGNRPGGLISWRDYTIGGYEIDTRRENLLEAGEIDPATVEQEYLDAMARYRAQMAAGLAWDERTGLAKQRRECDRAVAAKQRCAKRLGACPSNRIFLDEEPAS